MRHLSDTRAEQVRLLLEALPDGALRTLETALGFSDGTDPRLDEVRAMTVEERRDRALGAAVLTPIEPLCHAGEMASWSLPSDLPRRVWAALKRDEPNLVVDASEAARKRRGDEDPPPVFDALCRRAAERLNDHHGAAFSSLAATLDAERLGLAAQAADSLRLAPIGRAVLPRLRGWIRRMDEDCIAAIRVAYRDAETEGEDLLPAFTEMLAAHLEHPRHVLRLISAVMDRPSDRYLASSEMAGIGERLLSELDRKVDQVRRFEPQAGAEGAAAAAEAVLAATQIFSEFDRFVALGRDGPWATRLGAQKRALALSVEVRLRALGPAVETALPCQQVRHGRTVARGRPLLERDPDPQAVGRARGLLALLADTRASAAVGGFGATRNKTVEALDALLNPYVEELLDVLHASDEAVVAERARVFLELAAEFLGFVREPGAAEIVRRRAAAV